MCHDGRKPCGGQMYDVGTWGKATEHQNESMAGVYGKRELTGASSNRHQ